MSNIYPNQDQSNSIFDRNIRICFENDQIDLDALQLTSSEICAELQARVQNANQVIVEPVAHLLSMSDELLSNLLDLLSTSPNVLYRGQLGVGEPVELLDAGPDVTNQQCCNGGKYTTFGAASSIYVGTRIGFPFRRPNCECHDKSKDHPTSSQPDRRTNTKTSHAGTTRRPSHSTIRSRVSNSANSRGVAL